MLNMNNLHDREKMMNYYRTSEMSNLLFFFPSLSPVKDLIIIESVEDFLANRDYYNSFDQNRVDTIKGRKPILGIENAGKSNGFYDTILRVKEKDPLGVLVLFNINSTPSERYERYAGISVRVDLGDKVIIEAVSKGFDGREVSKNICVHERYDIPWYDLRKVSIDTLKKYQTYEIDNKDYHVTRYKRIEFLKSIGLNSDIVSKYIPKDYERIPDFVWKSVIRNLLKQLEKMRIY